MAYKIKNNKEEKKISLKKTYDLPMDFIQAEFSNLDSDESNTWKWKKGQTLHKWTTNEYFRIVKVSRYPKDYISVVEIDESEVK